MASLLKGQISFTFFELRELMASFDDLASTRGQSETQCEAIYQLVDHIGGSAVPTLLRKLFFGALSAQWAVELLLRLANSEARQRRIVRAVHKGLASTPLLKECRPAVAQLLSELGEEVPWPDLAEEADCARHSLCDLAASIESKAELARVADTLLADLPSEEVLEFVEELAIPYPAISVSLIGELVLRDDMAPRTRSALRQVAISAEVESKNLGVPRHELRSGAQPAILHGAQHDSGDCALIAYSLFGTKKPLRYRALSVLVSCQGVLRDCEYLEQVSRSALQSLFFQPLEDASYQLFPIVAQDMRTRVISAARLRINGGTTMPRAYYLGRDLMGLHDEHLPRRSSDAKKKTQDAALLARGTELLRHGRAALARDLLLQYTKAHPSDSEALATLGSCLMQTGEMDRAREYLRRASALAPSVGRYHWNCAALAHQEGRIGDCFLALQQYLGCNDERDASKTGVARELVAQYGMSNTPILKTVPQLPKFPKKND